LVSVASNEDLAMALFNLPGYLFEKWLGDVRRAYDATIDALETANIAAAACSLEFDRSLAAGETGASEYDESGEKLYDYAQLHAMLVEDSASIIPIARQAYVVILHHYWEKRCKEWMESGKKYKHGLSEVYPWLEAQGLAVDRDGLEILREASNTVKHNASNLFKRRPDMFDQPASARAPVSDCASLLRLRPDDIDRMFVAVKKSGPKFDSDFWPTFVPEGQLR
jgi:hypothetical protein